MSRFKRLTDTEARQLTRREILDRVEAEQAYWHRKRTMTEQDRAAFAEFGRIMHAYLDPAVMMQDLTDHIRGRPGAGRYMDTRPCDDGQPTGDPVVACALRLLARERETGSERNDT
jgi:hypothetical protein